MVQLAKVSKFQTKCGSVIEDYLDERKKHSEDAERSVRSDIGRFLKEEFSKTIDTITSEELDLVDYEILMSYRGKMYGSVANTTINRHISSIRTIYKHLKSRNILESDISYLDTIKNLPKKSKLIEYMPMSIVEEYIAEAGKDLNDAKEKQELIMLAVDTALRLDELLELELNQFTIDGEEVLIKGYGKGNKEFTDKISLERYNALLGIMEEGYSQNSKVFSTLTVKKVTDMMSKIKKTLGYEGREFSFHSFKKTAVTNVYRLTGDILEAQKKGRHSSLDTTRLYLQDLEYGITGWYSLGDVDTELYKKASHEELMEALGEMNRDFLHLLNIKLNSKKKNKMN